MFANTFSVNVLGLARTLTRVNQDKFASTYRYRDPALNIDLNIRHTDRALPGSTGVRIERHNVEMIATTFTVVSGVTIAKTSKAYLTFETNTGDDVIPVTDIVKGIAALFITVGANFTGLLNWES